MDLSRSSVWIALCLSRAFVDWFACVNLSRAFVEGFETVFTPYISL